jgi:thioredoxin 1
MNQGARRIIDTLAVVGAVIVIAEISFGAGLNTGPVAERPRAKRGTYTQKAGDTAFTATKRHGKVHRADEANFAGLVLKSDVPVLVDFYADWCGPCRLVAPVLEELARETTNVRIVKVNVDHSPRLAARYGINSIPSLKVFDDGEVVDEHVGLARKSQLKKMLAKQQSEEAPVEGGARIWMRR